MAVSLYRRSGISADNPYYKFICAGFFCLILYFIWMDIALFYNLQRYQAPPIDKKNETKQTDVDPFSTFNPLTVKLIMIDHFSHYVHDILARFLVDTMHLARLFPWVTANLVSFAGLFLALIGSRLTVSDNLSYRQLGALLFEFRNLADSMDGVFARARKRETAEYLMKHNSKLVKAPVISYASSYGTLGYNVDVICDVMGGAFFCAAIFYRFLRRPPQKNTNNAKTSIKFDTIKNDGYKYNKLENDSDYAMIKMDDPVDNENLQFKNLMSQNEKNLDTVKEAFAKSEYETQSSTRYFTSREVKIIVFSFGLRILCTGGLWDHYVHKYHDLLMVLSTNPTIRHQQEQAFKSVSMWLIMWFWRIVSACGMLEHLVYATFFDKLWDYLVFTTYIGWGFLCVLAMITQLHYVELSNQLNSIAAYTT